MVDRSETSGRGDDWNGGTPDEPEAVDQPSIVDQIKADVVETLGWYFPPLKPHFDNADREPDEYLAGKPNERPVEFDFEESDESLGGYQRIETFGENGVLEATTSDGRTFTIVRWELRGRHYRPVPSPSGDTTVVGATGNPVRVDGLTIVERLNGEFRARRYVDWLSVYAQLGVVFAGRPVGMAQAEVLDPSDLMRKQRRHRSASTRTVGT